MPTIPLSVAFIRVKTIHGSKYAYLSESLWDAEKKRSSQKVIKYLGPVKKLQLDQVPREHMGEGVRTFIYRYSDHYEERRTKAVEQARRDLLKALLSGSSRQSVLVSMKAMETITVTRFYDDVVTPVLHEVGEQWAEGKISVSDEHLASNTVRPALIRINSEIKWTGRKKGRVVVAAPDGEGHHLTALILEGLLLDRGYDVLDITASAPEDSIVDFVRTKKADMVLITVTLAENLDAARQLVDSLLAGDDDPRILVGGQAVRSGENPARFPVDVLVEPGESLTQAFERLGLA